MNVEKFKLNCIDKVLFERFSWWVFNCTGFERFYFEMRKTFPSLILLCGTDKKLYRDVNKNVDRIRNCYEQKWSLSDLHQKSKSLAQISLHTHTHTHSKQIEQLLSINLLQRFRTEGPGFCQFMVLYIIENNTYYSIAMRLKKLSLKQARTGYSDVVYQAYLSAFVLQYQVIFLTH